MQITIARSSGRPLAFNDMACQMPSAATHLAAFFAAAQHADSQIRHAAALISGDIGATSMRFTPATIAAVRGIELAPVASALPAGLRNSCSEDFGGYAPTSLEPIVWQPSTDQHSSHYEGLIGGVRFSADYTVQHGWTIIIYAC